MKIGGGIKRKGRGTKEREVVGEEKKKGMKEGERRGKKGKEREKGELGVRRGWGAERGKKRRKRRKRGR